MPLPDEYQNAVDLLESAGQHEIKINRILRWPGLRPNQRLLCFALLSLEHAWGHHPAVFEVAREIGFSDETLKAAFDGMDNPPFEVVTSEGQPRFQPHQTLEYGA